MRISATLTSLPFAIVGVLALSVGIAALCATPERPGPAAQIEASASPTADASVTPALASPTASATPQTSAPRPSPTDAVSRSNSADEMLRTHNALRRAVSAPAVRADDRVTAAAQRHAEYLARHGVIGHEESSGNEGFTGATVQDRLAAQGYAGATASEVATMGGDGLEGVRSLWVLPYHRLGLMHPHAIVAGWGHAESGGRAMTVGVIVYDFASQAPEVVRSPVAGQRVEGSWKGVEFPDPLPAGAARPVGYPVMLIASGARAVELRSARLADMSGRVLAHHVVPQIYERDYVAIVPAQPLASAARYAVRLELRIAGIDVIEEWEFETGP